MNKLSKLLSVLLLVAPLSQASCTKVKFEFDDQYFVGIQEHYYEIRSMSKYLTNDFIGDVTQAMGCKVFRLNVTMNNLFYVEGNDTVKFNTSTKEQMRKVVDKLIASGVERIVYATDSFIYPYGYKTTHTISVPDPYSERDAYERWLKVNSKGYGMMAAEFPEIKYFEPINEPDIPNNEVLCKNGMLWGTQQSEFMYTAEDEAHILADLCYYIRKEIKAVDENNYMMSAAYSSLESTYDYLEYCYQAIESGAHPVGADLPCSVNPDDYFDIIDLHPYSFVGKNVDPLNPTEQGIALITDNYVKACNKFYDICVKHGDAEKPHWYTELGFTDSNNDAAAEVIGREIVKQLDAIKNDLPYVECVILYKMCDFYEPEYTTNSVTEDHFGLFSSPANPEKPFELKPIMKSLYSWMHDGSTDYSVFDPIREKYAVKKETK